MKVRDIMQQDVTTVCEDDSLGLARQLMLWAGIRHLPTIGRADGRVVGLLGERDLLRALAGGVAGHEALSRNVRDFAIAEVETITPDADLADAAAMMVAKKLSCLVVLEAGELVGILTSADVLGGLAQNPLASAGPAAVPAPPGEASVAAIMYPEPIAVSSDESLLATAARMAKRNVRHACVVDDTGKLLGIVSDRDVRRVLGDPRRALAPSYVPEHLHRLRVGAVMSTAVVVNQDAQVHEALELLLREQVGALPVVDDDGRLRGLVSYVDLLRHFAPGSKPSAA